MMTEKRREQLRANSRKHYEKNKSNPKYVEKNRARCKKYRNKNKEKFAAANMSPKRKEQVKNTRLKRKYKIGLKEYDQMFVAQNGNCAICNKHQSVFNTSLGVDHNHTTGEVRGLLCYTCNSLLGYAHDDINKLLTAVKYLKKWSK